MKRQNRRVLMLCLVFFGSRLSRHPGRPESSFYIVGTLTQDLAAFLSSFDTKYLVAEFESPVGGNHGPCAPGAVL